MRPSTSALTSRRAAIGLAISATGAAVALSQYRGAQAPIRAASSSPASPTTATAMSGGGTAAAAAASGAAAPLRTPLAAVNLRDIGEVDPRLRKGVLFRCSQIYTPEVLRDLKIKTVVDLRGRAERSKRAKRAGGEAAGSSKHGRQQAPLGPPPLLPPDQVDALHASAAEAGGGGGDAQQGEGPPPGADGPSQQDLTVTRLRAHANGGGGGGGASMGSATESEDEGGNGGGGGMRLRAGREEVAVALGEEADWQQPDTEAFNVIPGRQFGYAMLRMPPRIWRSALGNLVTGKDPRRPFVDAFADEQLLGFTRYYKIILEHAKPNIAAVMRVFAKASNLPSLVHCAHGKDRTGVVIMLLLLICDVPHEAIVADYVQSEVELRRYRESLGLPDPSGATGAVIPLNDVIIASTTETLRALLAYMDANYLSVDNYLASCGLSQAEVAAIRANLLRPEAVAQQQGGGAAGGGGGAAAAAPPAGPARGGA